MTFNLLTTQWLEARRASGARLTIRPSDLTDGFADDPILALDFPRPDWNAALTEWLIGLYFLTLAPENESAWGERFRDPPPPDVLAAALAPLAQWFDLDGDGPRAFQDHDTLGNAEAKPLSALLIEAPGEQTTKNNADLFIKRGGAATLTLPEAAAALITLQTYAPAGGAGHRTSMRGGGPLTTLLSPLRQDRKTATLWDRVWANVPEAEPDTPDDPREALPWLSPTITSEKGARPVTPEDRHPALAFFACPRRIRLMFEEIEGKRVATGFRTLNYGANYLAWEHPLSPYRNDKKAGKLPLHPHAGASDYGDWVAWWGFNGAPAQSSTLWRNRRGQTGGNVGRTPVEAFGFDMDNMKARQWLNARLPWVPADEGELKDAIAKLIGGSDAAARAVRMACKVARYGQRNGDGYRLPDTLPVDALPEPADRLWLETQRDFETLLDALTDLLDDGPKPTADLRCKWRRTLRRHALRIFDETLDLDGLTDADPRRLLHARGQLSFALADHPKAAVLKALGIQATQRKPKDEPKEEAAQ